MLPFCLFLLSLMLVRKSGQDIGISGAALCYAFLQKTTLM